MLLFIQESALQAAVSWVNKNDSLTVGFDVTPIDTGLFSSNCSALAKVKKTCSIIHT